MRLEPGLSRTPVAHCVTPFSSPLPVLGWCRCFLCGHLSAIHLPLARDQANWIECEYCGLDNEIPQGTREVPVVDGRVPTRLF